MSKDELREVLGPQRFDFAEKYLISFNASQAAREAGYSEKAAGAIGHDLLKLTEMQVYLQMILKERSKKTGITAERVVEEIAKIAFHNVQDLLDYFDGKVYFNNLEDMQFPEIIKAITIKEQKNKLTGKMEGRITKIEVYDKVKALELLGKHTAAFTENINLTNNGGRFDAPKQTTIIQINHRPKEEPLTGT